MNIPYSLKCATTSTVIAIILNIVLSLTLSLAATDKEVSPPNGPAALSFKGQFMHMMVHHKQVLVVSSFIIGLVVFISCLLSCMILKH